MVCLRLGSVDFNSTGVLDKVCRRNLNAVFRACVTHAGLLDVTWVSNYSCRTVLFQGLQKTDIFSVITNMLDLYYL